MDKLITFQEKKYKFFRYCARECKGKGIQIIINNTLLICENNYETAVTYMNPRYKLLVREDNY